VVCGTVSIMDEVWFVELRASWILFW